MMTRSCLGMGERWKSCRRTSCLAGTVGATWARRGSTTSTRRITTAFFAFGSAGLEATELAGGCAPAYMRINVADFAHYSITPDISYSVARNPITYAHLILWSISCVLYPNSCPALSLPLITRSSTQIPFWWVHISFSDVNRLAPLPFPRHDLPSCQVVPSQV